MARHPNYPSWRPAPDYDDPHRLTQLTGGGLIAHYDYDGLGRRVLKTVNGHTTYYHYDAAGRLLAESDARDKRCGNTSTWTTYHWQWSSKTSCTICTPTCSARPGS